MRVKYDITTRDFYSYFTSNTNHCINYTQYKKILTTINTHLANTVLKGGVINMGTGKIAVISRTYNDKFFDDGNKPKHKYINWKATRELRKRKQPTWTDEDWKKIPIEQRPIVMSNNDHTNGRMYKIKWFKNKFNNAKIYNFRAYRAFARGLAAILKDPNNKIIYYAEQ